MSESKRYETDEEAATRLSEALKDLPDNWVMCRDVKHAWSVEEDFHVSLHKGSVIQEIQRILVCLRCGTKRRERYTPTKIFGLHKVGNAYEYPDNYQIHGVPRGVKPQWLVQGEQYRRTMLRLAEAQRAVR